METSPVFDDTHAFVIAPPSIHAINVATHAITWSISAGCTGQPATAGGVVYATCGGKLSARDAANGNELWAFDAAGVLGYPPVIAAGYVYVASPNNVYAVSIASHAQAWMGPVGGWLSIAAGRLFVARATGTLTTFVLANGP
jgi:outer membrane protein assembly factor BamB